MFQFVMGVRVVSLLMIACEPQRAKGDAFFFSLHTGVECQMVLGPLERLPPGTTPEATSAVHGTKCCARLIAAPVWRGGKSYCDGPYDAVNRIWISAELN